MISNGSKTVVLERPGLIIIQDDTITGMVIA